MNESRAHDLDRIEEILLPPTVALRVLDLLQAQEVSVARVASIVEGDPALAAAVLRLANAPLWGLSGRVDSVLKAVVLMGLDQVSQLVLTVAVHGAFQKAPLPPGLDVEGFWLHAVTAGDVARRLGPHMGLGLRGREYLAALLHDVGHLVLALLEGEDYRAVLEDLAAGREEESERGLAHGPLGAEVLARWNLPTTITAAVRWHHDPVSAPEHRGVVASVALADRLAHDLVQGEEEASPRSRELWAHLQRVVPCLAPLPVDHLMDEARAGGEEVRRFLGLLRRG